jgi:PST family polysaccharide transporter
MRLQVLAVSLPLAGFALFAPGILPLIFGERWNPVLQVFPFIAISYLSNAIFNLHASVLYLLNKNLLVTWFHLVHIALFGGSAMVLVPRLGFIGYGWAEICALVSYLVIHAYVDKEVGSPGYATALQWYGVALGMLTLSELNGPIHYLAFILPVLPLMSASERSVLGNYAQMLVRRTKSV